MTIQRMFPQNGPSAVRSEIADILKANLIAEDKIRTIYDYRTMPNLTAVELAITSIEAVEVQSPLLAGPYYDYIIDLRIRHNGEPEGLDAAEVMASELAREIWLLLNSTHATTYKDIFAYSPSAMPGAPVEVVNIRRAFLFPRAIPV